MMLVMKAKNVNHICCKLDFIMLLINVNVYDILLMPLVYHFYHFLEITILYMGSQGLRFRV